MLVDILDRVDDVNLGLRVSRHLRIGIDRAEMFFVFEVREIVLGESSYTDHQYSLKFGIVVKIWEQRVFEVVPDVRGFINRASILDPVKRHPELRHQERVNSQQVVPSSFGDGKQ